MKLKIENKENIRQKSVRKKTASRICAVQVLYESSFSFESTEHVIKSYIENYLDKILIDMNINNIDEDLFNSIIQGVNFNIVKIDKMIADNLSKKWSIDRLSKTEISVFRLAVFELVFLKQFTKNTIINEYVSIFEAFGGNINFANGILEIIYDNETSK